MRRRGGLPWIWGEPVTDTRLLPPVGAADARPAVRSIVVAAPAETVFGWVCQLRRAPYSYTTGWTISGGAVRAKPIPH